MPSDNLAELERELIDILTTQGLPVEEIRLVGLLGQGTRATVFSVQINGVYHVLKVYDSKDSLRAELKNLKKVTPKDRLLFSWQERLEDDRKINLAIIEVPEGQSINSDRLDPDTTVSLVEQIATLHRIKYRQKVSLTTLEQQFNRTKKPFFEHIALMGLDQKVYSKLIDALQAMLTKSPDLFRVHKVRVHGDLWWPNVIVSDGGVYLIDWESVHRGDACEDVAKLRTVLHFPSNDQMTNFFWRSPEHANQVAQLTGQLVDRHNQLGDTTMVERLKFYLPAACIEHLAQRYLLGNTSLSVDKAINQIVAEEALRLFENPLVSPPNLTNHNYFTEIQALRRNN